MERIEAFEAMLKAALEQSEAERQKMEALKAQGKEKSATYRVVCPVQAIRPDRPTGRVSAMWWLFALGSAVFAALTSILAKIGIEGVNSNLATAIRTVVVVAMAWGMVFLTHAQDGLASISRKSWLFLILSGLATGASWLCYYRALQLGEVSKVVPIDKLSVLITLALAFIFLHEQFTVKSLVGCLLIGAGTLVMVL